MRSFFCVALLIAGISMTSGKTALGQGASLWVEIDAEDVICNRFLGFGAEWDSSSYPQAGITEEDFSVIRERVKWMRLPVARIMMQAKWCYKGNETYDWDNPDMKALYRHLDVCQKIGTTVFLADWGCEPEWLRCPDVDMVDDPKYAEIIGTYVDHLVNRKGYTCIRYFIMVNEPNYEVKEWSRWKKGVENAFAKLPLKMHDLIDWYSIDSNTHGLNMHNLYVAGRLMRNPKVNTQTALREFIIGAFAKQNLGRVEKIFRAIKSSRRIWGHGTLSSSNLPVVREAHKLALEITIPKGFKPAFPMVISPSQLTKELVAQTGSLVKLYEFHMAVNKVKQMRKDGAGQDKIRAAIANIPKVSAPTEWLTNIDYLSYLQKRKELK